MGVPPPPFSPHSRRRRFSFHVSTPRQNGGGSAASGDLKDGGPPRAAGTRECARHPPSSSSSEVASLRPRAAVAALRPGLVRLVWGLLLASVLPLRRGDKPKAWPSSQERHRCPPAAPSPNQPGLAAAAAAAATHPSNSYVTCESVQNRWFAGTCDGEHQ